MLELYLALSTHSMTGSQRMRIDTTPGRIIKITDGKGMCKSESKNILIISSKFCPLNSPRALRTTELVKEFAKQGHEVTVLTARMGKHHDDFEKEYGVTIKDIGPRRLPKIVSSGGSRFSSLFKKILSRGLGLFFEYPDIELTWRVKKALRIESGYDLLISIAMPHTIHWGVSWARSEKHPLAKTWVADCGDPYVGMESDTFNVPRYFSIPEKRFCRKADYVSVPFEGSVEAYFPEFHHKIKVIPQGFSFPEPPPAKKLNRDIPVFAYAGNIRSYQHYATPFLEYLNSVEEPFYFIIYTKSPDYYRTHLTDETLKKCTIYEYVSREELFRQSAGIDFFLHFPYENSTQRSLKLVDYAHMKKPILSFENTSDCRGTFRRFLNGNYKGALEVENTDQYRIENVSRQFLDLCENE